MPICQVGNRAGRTFSASGHVASARTGAQRQSTVMSIACTRATVSERGGRPIDTGGAYCIHSWLRTKPRSGSDAIVSGNVRARVVHGTFAADGPAPGGTAAGTDRTAQAFR